LQATRVMTKISGDGKRRCAHAHLRMGVTFKRSCRGSEVLGQGHSSRRWNRPEREKPAWLLSFGRCPIAQSAFAHQRAGLPFEASAIERVLTELPR
jgi:hypothetical protein